MRQPDSHIDSQELEILRGEFAGLSAEQRESYYVIRKHLMQCEDCSDLAKIHRILFRHAQSDFLSTNSACPSEKTWFELVAGLLPAQDAGEILAHASRCNVCAELLREATDTISPATADEALPMLASSTPEWHQKLGSQLSQMNEVQRNAKKASPSGRRLDFLRPLIWVSFAAVLLLCIALVSSHAFRRPDAAQLLSSAYSKDRNLELRIPDAQFSPYHANDQRSSTSTINQSASLLEARGVIARALEKNPDDPKWLELRARADLLDGNLEQSLETSNRLLVTHPTDRNLLLDASTAYFELGQARQDKYDIGISVDLLGRLLRNDPKDRVALYNQAIAFKELGQLDNAVQTWKAFLSVEEDPAWISDARRRLGEIESEIRDHKTSHESSQLSDREIDQLAANLPIVQSRDEELSTIGLTRLLEAAFPMADSVTTELDRSTGAEQVQCEEVCQSARSVLRTVADSLEQNHGDPWLKDLLRSGKSRLWIRAVQVLATSIKADSRGSPGEGLKSANTALLLFKQDGNYAGEERARVEQMYAYQRLVDGRGCMRLGRELDSELMSSAFRWMQVEFAVDYASCYAIRDQFDEQRSLLARASNVAKISNYRIAALRTLGINAAMLRSLGDYETAWQLDVSGLSEYWAGHYPPLRAYQFYSDLAYAESFRAHAYLSMYLHREALAAIEQLDMPSVEAATRFRFVRSLLRSGYEFQAEQELKKAEGSFARMPQAQQLRIYLAECLLDLARLKIEQNKIKEAVVLLNQAESSLKGSSNPRLELSLIASRASLLMQEGDWQRAFATFTKAAQYADETAGSLDTDRDRTSWLRGVEPIYAGLTLSSFMVNNDAPYAIAEWERYRAKFLGSPRAIHCAQVKTTCMAQTILSVKSQIDQAALIGNIVFDKGVLIWRIDHSSIGMQFVPVPKSKLMSELEVFTELAHMPGSSEKELRQNGLWLSHLLIEPVWKGSDAGHVLYLEPDAVFSGIPFAALPMNDSYLGLVSPLASIISLMEHDSIHPLPSQGTRVLKPGNALIVGNPALHNSSIPSLPDAALEARSIAEEFNRPVLLLGEAATRTAVLRGLSSASVFHFAGHSQSWTTGTRLLVSPTSIDHADRTPATIDSADIVRVAPKRCRLVVLSSCSTGSRDLPEPDVISDMVRSFAQVGVPDIIATHWDVDSFASAILMRKFYQELIEGYPVPVALAHAQARMIANGYRNPRFWASYYAIGFGQTNFKEILHVDERGNGFSSANLRSN
jgi:CHAT domain-containing protein